VSDETVTFKSRGVSNTGEVLLGSIEVQAVMQDMVNDYEKRDLEQQAEGRNKFVEFCKRHKSITGTAKLIIHGLSVEYQSREQANQFEGGAE